jgi:hypothetical protein
MLSRSPKVSSYFALLVVALFLLMTLDPALAAPEPEPEHLVDPQVVLQGERPPPQVTPYYVKATTGQAVASGSLSPKGLQINDSLAEITVPGPQMPRFLLSRVGRFTMQINIGMPLEVMAVSHVSVWAKSNEDVQNANYRILFLQNGNTRANMRTNTANLNNMPMEFTVPDPPTFGTPLTFVQGDRMEMEIQYTASSRRLIGPAPGCVVLASNMAHPTRIELLCRPLEMNVSNPKFIDEHMHITGKVVDTSELDAKSELHINLDIVTSTGSPAPQDTIERMNFQFKEPTGENIINWSWDWRKLEVSDGLFEFKIDVSYGVLGKNYTNSSYVEIAFPKEKRSGSALTPNQMYMIIVIVAVVLVVAGVWWRRRTPRGYSRYPRGRGPPPRRARRKPSRAERKALKKGLPPPAKTPPPARGPSAGRTPMPGRAPPPGARRHPGKVPDGRQAARGVGAPRPRR